MKYVSFAPSQQGIQPFFLFSSRSHIAGDPLIKNPEAAGILQQALQRILLKIRKIPAVSYSLKITIFEGHIQDSARLYRPAHPAKDIRQISRWYMQDGSAGKNPVIPVRLIQLRKEHLPDRQTGVFRGCLDHFPGTIACLHAVSSLKKIPAVPPRSTSKIKDQRARRELRQKTILNIRKNDIQGIRCESLCMIIIIRDGPVLFQYSSSRYSAFV